MKNKIIALFDYKNKFGSKHFDTPYRSGFDKSLLSEFFGKNGYDIQFEHFHQVDLRNIEKYKGANILYTSSEDIGYHYKSYIEDVVYALELNGANVIPSFKYLRANNNKVFMEFLRTTILNDMDFYSNHYGSLKDLLLDLSSLRFPIVLKNSEGASGSGVSLIKTKDELIKKIKKLKNYNYIKEDVKDFFRPYKHKGYKRESRYRNKFILQPFIPNLKNDWKVYLFGEKLYVFKRPIQKGRGIKASGGGYDNYLYDLDAKVPDGMFDFSYDIFKKLGVPHVSLDIAYDGVKFYLIEFQGLYFGTAGIPYSKGYFIKKNNSWEFVEKKHSIEKVYSDSIMEFIS